MAKLIITPRVLKFADLFVGDVFTTESDSTGGLFVKVDDDACMVVVPINSSAAVKAAFRTKFGNDSPVRLVSTIAISIGGGG